MDGFNRDVFEMNDSYKKRMKDIAKAAIAPPGTPEYKKQEEWFREQERSDPRFRKEQKRIWQKVQALLHTTMSNGAGLLADQTIREFWSM